jgi:hypothetical protein
MPQLPNKEHNRAAVLTVLRIVIELALSHLAERFTGLWSGDLLAWLQALLGFGVSRMTLDRRHCLWCRALRWRCHERTEQ